MVLSLFEVTVLLLCIAFSGLHVLQPTLDHLRTMISPRNPILSAGAGAAALLVLPAAYFTSMILVYLQIAPPALVSPVALRLLAAMACALLLLLAVVPWM